MKTRMMTVSDDALVPPPRLWPTVADITARVQACRPEVAAWMKGLPIMRAGGPTGRLTSDVIDPIPDHAQLLTTLHSIIRHIRQSRPSRTARLVPVNLALPRGVRCAALIPVHTLLVRYICDDSIGQDRLVARMDCLYTWGESAHG